MSTRRIILLVSLMLLSAFGDSAGGGGGGNNDESGAAGLLGRPLRPSLAVSDKILPIQLVDAPEESLQAPRRKQLRVQTLLAILGSDFDPFWMSPDKPAATVEEGPSIAAAGRPSEWLTEQLRELDLRGDNATTKVLEDFLLRKASCPVRYVWDDVGPLFWPRWVKRGECRDDPRASCSWPAGMHCVPAESVTFHLLRWHCRPRPRRAGPHDHRPQRCQWLRVPYPVTSQCFCSC